MHAYTYERDTSHNNIYIIMHNNENNNITLHINILHNKDNNILNNIII